MQVPKLPARPSRVAIWTSPCSLLKNIQLAMNAKIAQTMAAERGKCVGYALRMAVGQDAIDDQVEAFLGKHSYCPMQGTAHWDSEDVVSTVVQQVREEPIGLDMQEWS